MESSEEWDYWDESGKVKECINGRNNGHLYLLVRKQLIIVGGVAIHIYTNYTLHVFIHKNSTLTI
jgi:hypothetical protein